LLSPIVSTAVPILSSIATNGSVASDEGGADPKFALALFKRVRKALEALNIDILNADGAFDISCQEIVDSELTSEARIRHVPGEIQDRGMHIATFGRLALS
jgi:hypothetical protein